MDAQPRHTSELLSPTQRRLILVGMMAGVSLAAIDQMVLATAVAAITHDLGDITQGPWLFTANLLTSSASMPIWGKLSDLYGRRRIYQCAIVLFIAASLLAARSESMIELVVCRALQGLGGGALLTVPNAIIGDIVAPAKRPAYLAFSAAVWAGAGLIGPPLGGFLVDGPGWRWMFYLNVPAGVLAISLIQYAYRLPQQRIEHRIDAPGAALLVATVGSLILFTSWAGPNFGFYSLAALGFVATSVLCGIGFVLQERRASEPIVELRLLTLPAVRPALLTTGFFGFANFSIAFFMPLYVIVVNGQSATQGGLALMPLTLGLFVSGLFVGLRAAATGRFRRYAVGGLVLYISGLLLLTTMVRDTPSYALWSYSLLLGLGSGAINPIVVSSLQNAVPQAYLGIASSLPGFTRAVAQTVGTAVLGSFLALRMRLHLARDVAPLAPDGLSVDRLVAEPGSISGLDEVLQLAVAEAYRGAFNETFYVMMAMMGMSLLSALFIHDPASD